MVTCHLQYHGIHTYVCDFRMENIRYGRLDATDEEVKQAAKAVSADTVVEHLENGYDSDVGEGGDKLSTGEKQLISFARAVLADPAIFVLDEATSGLDPAARSEILDILLDFIQDERHSVLLSSHITTDLEQIADTIAYLHPQYKWI